MISSALSAFTITKSFELLVGDVLVHLCGDA